MLEFTTDTSAAATIDGFGDNTSADFSRVASSQPANSSLVWQPLRATFRPLNRQQPRAAPQPEALALASSSVFVAEQPEARQPTFATSTTVAPAAAAEIDNFDQDDEQPTRVPLNRFRPTRPPSVDPQAQPLRDNTPFGAASGSQNNNTTTNSQPPQHRMSNECFECICEASTSCNLKSRCQTSDVRHTRCGLFLISYDQWLDTGLSKQLVTREALQRDAAADERAFYECVTDRECAERLLAIYMQRNAKDCDKDGRIDCYDMAAIHQGGTDGCAGESLLDSQYWSDFNACFGFGR